MVACFNLTTIYFQLSREKRKSVTHTKPCISSPLAMSGLVAEIQVLATQVLIWGKDGNCVSGQEKNKRALRSREKAKTKGKLLKQCQRFFICKVTVYLRINVCMSVYKKFPSPPLGFIRNVIVLILIWEWNTKPGVIFQRKQRWAFEDANSYTSFCFQWGFFPHS